MDKQTLADRSAARINRMLTVLAAGIVITVGLICSMSFDGGKPTCTSYMTNVYMYLLLGLLITSFSVLFIAKKRFPITATKSIVFFAIAVAMIFLIQACSSERVITIHIAWIVFLIAISVSVYSVWRYSDYGGILANALVLVIGLTAVVYLAPGVVQMSWGPMLTIALVALILAMLVPALLPRLVDSKDGPMPNYYKALSALSIVIFSGFLLWDTRLLRIKGEQCTIPNYPADSLGLFLNVINLFGGMVNVQA